MRVYRGAVCCDVVFHTMLGMLVGEGGRCEFWIIGEELAGTRCRWLLWCRGAVPVVGEGDGWDRGEGGGVYEPLALEVDQERVGAQEIRSKNRLGDVGEDKFPQETFDPTFSCKVHLPKVRMALPLAAVRTGPRWPERVSELVAGSTYLRSCVDQEIPPGKTIPG